MGAPVSSPLGRVPSPPVEDEDSEKVQRAGVEPISERLTPGARTAVIEIAGVAFPIPAGTILTPETDAEGRLWYRIGMGTTRIGPIS